MKYKIFQIRDVYNYDNDGEKEDHIFLEPECDDYDFNSVHDSIESAMEEIRKHKNKFKERSLTVLPIIRFDWFENELDSV